ncbi:sugar ABC transporter substrate-binding protein [Nocardioides sp. AN3]
MRRAKTARLLVSATVAGLALSACSNSGGGNSASSSDAGGDDAAGVAAAKAYLQTISGNPSDIVLKTPLSKKPEPGKLIVRLVTPQPVAKVASDGTAAGAAALGWSYKAIPVGTGPEDIQKAFEAALALKPAPLGIVVSGYPKVTFAKQLAEAKSKGIAVISEATTDPAGTGDGIVGLVNGPSQVRIWGKDVAAQVVADSNGKAKVAMFSISAYPILGEFVKGFKEALSEWCPSCTVTDVDQQATDVGTKTPQSVVSTFQRNPKLNYAIFSLGDLTIGVDAAVKSAGLTNVKIAGEVPAAANLQAIKDGNELAWTGLAAAEMGWRGVDGLARYANGDPLDVVSNTPLPTQVITTANVGSIVTGESGYYVGLTDYAGQFKKLWQVE